MSIPNSAIINVVPAAAELRKVQGFNPLRYLRQTVSKQSGEKVVRLDLPYKRLWFRLACPDGRLLLNPLRITEQIAIYEAMVFQNREETVPLSRVTASVTLNEVENGRYIEAAQDKALNEALDNAGFGIQLYDIVSDCGRAQYGSELPLAQIEETKKPTPPASQNNVPPVEAAASKAGDSMTIDPIAPAQTAPVVKAPVKGLTQPSGTDQAEAKNAEAQPSQEKMDKSDPAKSEAAPGALGALAGAIQALNAAPDVGTNSTDAEKSSVLPVEGDAHGDVSSNADEAVSVSTESIPAQSAPEAKAVEPKKDAAEAAPSALEQLAANTQRVVNFPAPEHNPKASEERAEVEPASMPANTAQAANFTADMTVQEISARMTLEEAFAVKVETGICKGWTLKQVAERRLPSLKFYVNSTASNNILKAAAQIVLDNCQLKKAG